MLLAGLPGKTPKQLDEAPPSPFASPLTPVKDSSPFGTTSSSSADGISCPELSPEPHSASASGGARLRREAAGAHGGAIPDTDHNGLMQLVRHEVTIAVGQEADRIMQAVTTTLSQEGARWAEACGRHAASMLKDEQGACEKSRLTLEQRLSELDACMASHEQEMRDVAQVWYDSLSVRLTEVESTCRAWEMDGAKAASPHGAGALCAECRPEVQRLGVLVRASEAQARALEMSVRRVDAEASRRVGNVEKAYAEVKAAVAQHRSCEGEEATTLAIRMAVLESRLDCMEDGAPSCGAHDDAHGASAAVRVVSRDAALSVSEAAHRGAAAHSVGAGAAHDAISAMAALGARAVLQVCGARTLGAEAAHCQTSVTHL